jgi:hypothetical protein
VTGSGLTRKLTTGFAAVALMLTGACGKGAVKPASSPSGTKSVGALFPAIYPVRTLEKAKALQAELDQGHGTPRGDPLQVAKDAAGLFCGWDRVEARLLEKKGSAAEGWTAEVNVQPYFGENPDNEILGPEHRVSLIGLKFDTPVWFATSIKGTNIEVDKPAAGATITSPVEVAGRGIGFEGTINTEIRDDQDKFLHPNTDPNSDSRGFVMGGSTEVAPFSGKLPFSKPTAPGGVLVMKSDTGAGPTPNCTAVRVGFAS